MGNILVRTVECFEVFFRATIALIVDLLKMFESFNSWFFKNFQRTMGRMIKALIVDYLRIRRRIIKIVIVDLITNVWKDFFFKKMFKYFLLHFCKDFGSDYQSFYPRFFKEFLRAFYEVGFERIIKFFEELFQNYHSSIFF